MSFSGIKSLITFRQVTEPSSPDVGDIWLNTTEGFDGQTKIWTGSQWDTIIPGGTGYGYIMGGYSHSTIDKIKFPFDSGTSTVIGTLSEGKTYCSYCNSSIHGYCLGGVSTSLIERIKFHFESGTSELTGTLSFAGNHYRAACNSSNHGFIFGHYQQTSNIYRLTFPHDSGSTTYVGTIRQSLMNMNSVNSSIHGYSMAGLLGATAITHIDRITFPHNSGSSTAVGNLAHPIYESGNCNSSTHGFCMGGYYGGGPQSTIDKITFPFDSGTGTINGNLATGIYIGRGCNSSNYGYNIGGAPSGGGALSSIQRIEFPHDSGTATAIGNLSRTQYGCASVDNTDFVTQFV